MAKYIELGVDETIAMDELFGEEKDSESERGEAEEIRNGTD